MYILSTFRLLSHLVPSVSEPSLLYPPWPSLVNVCSIPNSFAQWQPACSHWLLLRTWKTRLPLHPHTFLQTPFTSCRVTAGEPSPNFDCGFWIHQLSLPSLLQTPSLGLSTCWQILGSLALRTITSPPYFSSACSSKLLFPCNHVAIDGFSPNCSDSWFTGILYHLVKMVALYFSFAIA